LLQLYLDEDEEPQLDEDEEEEPLAGLSRSTFFRLFIKLMGETLRSRSLGKYSPKPGTTEESEVADYLDLF